MTDWSVYMGHSPTIPGCCGNPHFLGWTRLLEGGPTRLAGQGLGLCSHSFSGMRQDTERGLEGREGRERGGGVGWGGHQDCSRSKRLGYLENKKSKIPGLKRSRVGGAVEKSREELSEPGSQRPFLVC